MNFLDPMKILNFKSTYINYLGNFNEQIVFYISILYMQKQEMLVGFLGTLPNSLF